MKPEEFKEKFKVGDKIRGSWWLKSYEDEMITAIGQKSFLTIQSYENCERWRDIPCSGEDNYWIKVEPEKVPMKPSKIINEKLEVIWNNSIVVHKKKVDLCNDRISAIIEFLDDANWPTGK